MIIYHQTMTGKSPLVYNGNAQLPFAAGPNVWEHSFVMTAELDIAAGTEGVIACSGGLNGGWTFYLQNDNLNFEYNFFDFEKYKGSSQQKVPSGKVAVKAVYASNGPCTGETMKLFLNDQPA